MFHPFKHLCTVINHKNKVFALACKCGIPWQGFTHDLSKFSPAEFIPGARYWNGHESPQVTERKIYGYSAAWMHHKGRNKHHFEYWTDYVKGVGLTAIRMPVKYVAEMFCDRVAACKVYQGCKYTDRSALEYFDTSRKKYFINEETAELLRKLLLMLSLKGEDYTCSFIKENLLKNGYDQNFDKEGLK